MCAILLSFLSGLLLSFLLGCGWRVIRFWRGIEGFLQCLPMAAAVRQAGRLVLPGQGGQRAVQKPGTAKPDAD